MLVISAFTGGIWCAFSISLTIICQYCTVVTFWKQPCFITGEDLGQEQGTCLIRGVFLNNSSIPTIFVNCIQLLHLDAYV